MATFSITSLLEERLEKAKENLEDVEENIRKLTGGGREPGHVGERRVSVGDTRRLVVGEQRRVVGDVRRISGDQRRFSGDQRQFSGDQWKSAGDQRRISLDSSMGKGRGRGLTVQKLTLMERLGAPPAKRQNLGSPFSRLGNRVGPRNRANSDDEDEEQDHKPLIQSSVVATPTSLATRTRQQSIKDHSKDKASVDRNKRMFGHLLGTLQKFRDESVTKTDKDKRRKEIENKLEEKAVEEKKAVAEEKKHLFQQRKEKQAELTKLEQLVELTQEHKEWDAHTLQLSSFIRTKAKPHLYYRPAKWTLGTEKLLKETKQFLNSTVEKRRTELDKKVAELEGKKTGDDRKTVNKEEEVKKERRRSGEQRGRRHSNRDEVKGKKDEKVSHRDEVSKHEKEERKGKEKKRTRKSRDGDEDDEKETPKSKEIVAEMSATDSGKVEEMAVFEEKTEDQMEAEEAGNREDMKGQEDGKDEGKYEEGMQMEENEGHEVPEPDREPNRKRRWDSMGGQEAGAGVVSENGKGEGKGEVGGDGDGELVGEESWGNVGWGMEDEVEAQKEADTTTGQIEEAQNDQEQLDYIYDDI
ncbi:uncharacterized protein [Diadema antillarum]|uniref:uncharacterized protein n=1 Tax=Diadema antillarum TaxID=105358 RepID=UPI003A8BE36C